MSNQVYSNQNNLYSNQEYSFTTDLLGTSPTVSVTLKIIKTNANTIKIVFPETPVIIGLADTLIDNSIALPEQFRPIYDTYASLCVADVTAGVFFQIALIKLQTTGIFLIGENYRNDLFIAGNSYIIHHCICEFPI